MKNNRMYFSVIAHSMFVGCFGGQKTLDMTNYTAKKKSAA